MNWQPIETAPRGIDYTRDGHAYSVYILAYPVFGEVARVRWWQSADKSRSRIACNFLEDGGNAVFPTHWMPLPPPPKD